MFVEVNGMYVFVTFGWYFWGSVIHSMLMRMLVSPFVFVLANLSKFGEKAFVLQQHSTH